MFEDKIFLVTFFVFELNLLLIFPINKNIFLLKELFMSIKYIFIKLIISHS